MCSKKQSLTTERCFPPFLYFPVLFCRQLPPFFLSSFLLSFLVSLFFFFFCLSLSSVFPLSLCFFCSSSFPLPLLFLFSSFSRSFVFPDHFPVLSPSSLSQIITCQLWRPRKQSGKTRIKANTISLQTCGARSVVFVPCALIVHPSSSEAKGTQCSHTAETLDPGSGSHSLRT